MFLPAQIAVITLWASARNRYNDFVADERGEGSYTGVIALAIGVVATITISTILWTKFQDKATNINVQTPTAPNAAP